MNRIETKFNELKERNEKALICFLTAGDPNVDTTEKLVLELESAGVDIVEIGIPFSDPLADGPSIQASSQRALDGGISPKSAIELIQRVRNKSSLPIVIMTYYNLVQKYGAERFANDAATAGADGVILTDLPPEESMDWKKAAADAGLATIYLLAPTSTEARIESVAKLSTGFIYCVSRTGVTGARKELSVDVAGLVGRIRMHTDKPIAVGFGVSAPEQVAQISSYADGAVVGSALVDFIASKSDDENLLAEVSAFASNLKAATRLL